MTERCEAEIRGETLDQGASRLDYDFEGRQIDHGEDFEEHPAKEEMTISCERCGLSTKFVAEGGAPYGAINEARRQAREFIKMNCRKLRETGLSPEQMPGDWIPGF